MTWNIKTKISKELFESIKHCIVSIKIENRIISDDEARFYIKSNFVK